MRVLLPYGLLVAWLLVLAGCSDEHARTAVVTPAAEATAATSIAAIATPAAAVTIEPGTPRRALPAGGPAAPEFPVGLEWLNSDRPLSIQRDLRGKVVLLDFWTLGCINCQHIIPDKRRLEAEFGDGLVIIGVHSGKYQAEKAIDSIRAAVERYELTHPVVNDPDFAVWDAYRVRAWPTLVLIDPEGAVAGSFAGEGIYPVFAPVIRSMLTEFRARGALDDTPTALGAAPNATLTGPLAFPEKVLADAAGGRLFIADSGHHRILVVGLASGDVRAVIGSSRPGLQDGAFERAQFRGPRGMALTEDGSTLYVADTLNHAIRRVDLVTGMVTTIGGDGRQAISLPSGGPAATTRFSSPWDVVLAGTTLYIASAGTHQIWSMDARGERVTVFAGSGAEGIDDGGRSAATLAQPEGLAVDGDYLYWVDAESSALRRTRLDGEGRVITLVGTGLFDFGDVDGAGAAAQLQHPEGLTAAGGRLYVTDTYNHKVKLVDPASFAVRTLAGSSGADDQVAVRFNQPAGASVAGDRLYVADRNNHAIQVIDLRSRQVSTMPLGGRAIQPAGSSPDDPATLELPGQTAGPGRATVALTVSAPDGHRLNSLAPSRLEVVGVDPRVIALDDRSISWQSNGQQATVELAGRLSLGQTRLRLAATIYYCRTERAELCFVKRVELAVSVAVEAGDQKDRIRLFYQLQPVAAP